MTSETGYVEAGAASSSGRFETQHRQIGRKSRRAYLKAGALLLLALIAGAVIGAGGALLYIKSRMHRQMPKAAQIGRSVLERLGESVSLTADEKTRLEAVVLSHMANVDRVRDESLAAISREFDSMNDQVDEILGPARSEQWEADKRKRYGKFYRDKSQRHTEASRRAGGPGQGPGNGPFR